MKIAKDQILLIEVSVLVPELADLGFFRETLILKTWNISDLIGQNDIYLQMELCTPFLKTVDGSSRNRKPQFSNFFCRNSYHCLYYISEITAPLSLKFCTEVTSYVLDPKPQVSSELVSPIRIYDYFPKVTCYRTVQNSEVVRASTCHCCILWV